MKFLRNLLAAILGCLIAFGIMFVMFFIFAALVGSSNDGVNVKSNSILELSFSEPISDYLGKNADDPFGSFFQEGQGLDEILHAIGVAQNDTKIKGISMTTNFLQAGFAQTQEIRRALQEFKASGKFVYSYSDFYTQKDYYLASVADQMYLNPQGAMDFKGLASEVLYYKDLQEKTGVKMEVIRHGKYKSAVEPFLSNTMSDENRSQIKELITSIWTSMLEDISESRNIDVPNLNTIADTLGGRMPQYAAMSGLIDGNFYFDEYEGLLRERLGVDEDTEINYVSLNDYVMVANKKTLKSGADKIAVIFAQGEILYGEGGKEYLGQGAINRALKKVRDNDNVKAIVLRVDSPGGSALVSDIIWREIELTKKEKPVVVSFGNVAASGGYYIAAGADKIFAEPTTITGSIGVFGTIPNIAELAEDIGINAEQVGTNENSVDYSLFEPVTDSFRQQILEGIENTYDTFLERVAAGRNMSVDEVNEIAQGRVWSGVDAQNLGLVDEIGNLDDAIEAAAEMVDLESFGIGKYPKYKSDFERLMEDLGSAKTMFGDALLKEELNNEIYQTLKEIKGVTKKKGVQARMPYTLHIK
ncbi:signal peptide peptidase SppA [Croceitalea rosinachiae]|uniref:Signal peptide peptidase SppA n=1 Tax=Croceitalea rosinachiae TaxID=3075596 RepID=A0ABU3A709_9FLAO|nr:signal peptide peptidase SppA [Croceitalea sp. F388]MDT0605615.1 signal peptide peptidase SppA [Croceitalea sp. F388]